MPDLRNWFLLILIFWSIAPDSTAQESIQLTDKHVERLEKETDSRKRFLLYRKFYSKDSIRYLRELDRKFKQQSDSIYKKAQWVKQKQEEIGYELPVPDEPIGIFDRKPGSLSELGYNQNDISKSLVSKADAKAVGISENRSLEILKSKIQESETGAKIIKGKDDWNSYHEYLDQYKDYLNNPDSVDVLAKKIAEKQVKEMSDRLLSNPESKGALNKIKESEGLAEKIMQAPTFPNNQNLSMDEKSVSKESGVLFLKEKAVNFLEENDQLLTGVSQKMDRLKKRYSRLGNSSDMTTVEKRNSLKGKKMTERLYTGGNFQVLDIKPFALDLSPMLGYYVRKPWIVGIGGVYRQTFGEYDSLQTHIAENQLGYLVFSQYAIKKGFFSQFNYQRSLIKNKEDSGEKEIKQWVATMALGIGKNLQLVNRINSTILIQYNFLFDSTKGVYNSPWMLRAGFNLIR